MEDFRKNLIGIKQKRFYKIPNDHVEDVGTHNQEKMKRNEICKEAIYTDTPKNKRKQEK